ncbi:MAG TPA: AsmA-like C-terminal domain-containing protein [Stellaceae bacterium]|nr:AsmA-like C-terminal domain-containing protein [Stellaceae bacterium]
MFLRSAINVAEWVGAVLGTLALVAGGCFWLLSRGPISLDWLAPYVAATFSQRELGVSARVDHTLIHLGAGPSLEIIARGLHLKRADGGTELALPEVALSLSPEAALLGKIAPTRIALHGARLNLLRAADGSFHLGLAGEQPGSNDWAESLLRELAHPPDHVGAFGYLTRVEVRDAGLTVDDRKLGVTWEAQRLDATLRRGTEGFAGDLALAVQRDGHLAQLHGDFQFESAPQHLRMTMSFDGLRPSLYAAATPALAPFAAFDLPLGGQISMTLGVGTRRVTDFWCDLQLGEGRIVNDRFAGGALKIARGTMRAVYDPTSGRLDLENFHAVLNAPNGPKLDFTGAVERFDPLSSEPQSFTGHLQVSDLAFSDFGQLWPQQVAIHAREWIMAHLLAGDMTQGDVRLSGKIQLGMAAGLSATVDKINGDFAYRDVAIQYFPPLAPVSHIDGTARFDRASFELTPKGGVSRDVRITSGTIHLTKLDTDSEEATIDLKLNGPLATILGELNSKPLRYAQALGIDPARVKGTASGALHFHLPMKKNLRFAQIDYSARGELNDIAIGKEFFDRDLTAGNLRLAVDRGKLDLAGTARLEGVPVTIDWTENFAGDPVRTRYRLQGTFDNGARRKLGIDWLTDTVSGPIGVDLAFARRRNDVASSDVTLDLGQASLSLARLGWKKKPGVPVSAHFTIAARDNLPTRIEGMRIHGGGLDAELDVTLSSGETDAKISRADIQHLTVGQTDVAGAIARRPEGGWSVQIHGANLNASTLLDDLQNSTPATTLEPPLMIDADLGRVILGPGRTLQNVHASMFSNGVHWQAARIDAALSPGKSLTLRYGAAAGDRNFRLASDDLGGLLRLMDISSRVQGGHLSVTAQAEDVGATRMLHGKFEGTNYRVVGAPAFARLLSAASFTGAAALMSGQGIPFSRVQGDFDLGNGKIDLSNARAYGEAIGINAHGRFDYRANTLDMSGTLVPAYLLNSLLSNIPILGDLLLGGKGQGIFAANFRVAGSAVDPSISVNPLSALAPGFLRRLFLFDAGGPGTDNARRAANPSGG